MLYIFVENEYLKSHSARRHPGATGPGGCGAGGQGPRTGSLNVQLYPLERGDG